MSQVKCIFFNLFGTDRYIVYRTREILWLKYIFLVSDTEDTRIIELVLQANQSLLDHLANEIVVALMRTVVDNFRIFASRVPIKHYYQYVQTNL